MPGDFNPYREWLGLSADHLPSHYELLSLPLFEHDFQRIAAAAERATAKVRGFRPGPNARAWSQLLDEIASAKACLLDANERAAYDRALRAGTLGTNTGESRTVTTPSALAPLQGELYPPGMAPRLDASTWHTGSTVSEASGPVLHVAPQARPQWSELDPPGPGERAMPARVSSPAPLGVPADVDPMAPVAPVGTGSPATLSASAKETPMDAVVLSDAGGSPFAPQFEVDARIGARRQRSPLGMLLVCIGGGLLLAALVMGFVFIQHHHFRPSKAEDPGGLDNAVAETAPIRNAEAPPDASPQAAPLPIPPSKAAPVNLPAPPMPETAPLPASPAASPPQPEQPLAVTRAEVQALIKALDAARAALGEQNITMAEQELATAASLAKLPKHQQAVARLQEVSGYVKQFRQAVSAAVQGLQPGESFQVGTSTEVAFVSGSADEVTLRIAGANRKFALSGLPAQLALELSNFKLEANRPRSRIVQGAYLAVHKQADSELKQKELERAQALWNEAAEAGANVAHLLPVLSENYANFINDATADGK